MNEEIKEIKELKEAITKELWRVAPAYCGSHLHKQPMTTELAPKI